MLVLINSNILNFIQIYILHNYSNVGVNSYYNTHYVLIFRKSKCHQSSFLSDLHFVHSIIYETYL